jgi:hypothetical protein
LSFSGERFLDEDYMGILAGYRRRLGCCPSLYDNVLELRTLLAHGGLNSSSQQGTLIKRHRDNRKGRARHDWEAVSSIKVTRKPPTAPLRQREGMLFCLSFDENGGYYASSNQLASSRRSALARKASITN